MAKSIYSSQNEEKLAKLCLYNTNNGFDLALILIKNGIAMRETFSLSDLMNNWEEDILNKWPIDIEEKRKELDAQND